MKKAGLSEPMCTVTAEYDVKLLAPTPMDKGPLIIKAKVTESGSRSAQVEASLEAGGKVTARCTGTFVNVKEGHPAYNRW